MKPKTKMGYTPADLDAARMTCLAVATKLHDFVEDIVVVGGLVPSLLIGLDAPVRHAGTLDADIGIAARIRDDKRYRSFEAALRSGDFEPALNDKGRPKRQTWRLKGAPARLTVDFLVEARDADAMPGKLLDLTQDLAPIVSSALDCAFADKILIALEGKLPSGAKAKRDIYVCGPAAFVVLKAIALRNRDENKDAYDLDYVLRHWKGGRTAIASRIVMMKNHTEVEKALHILAEDFETPDHRGPEAVAEFDGDAEDFDLRADVTGRVRELLSFVARG